MAVGVVFDTMCNHRNGKLVSSTSLLPNFAAAFARTKDPERVIGADVVDDEVRVKCEIN